MSTGFPGRRLLCCVLLSAALAGLGGCAGPGGLFTGNVETPPFRDPAMSMQTAREAIVIGQWTKAEVSAALGPATVVDFDSGFAVWVYRPKTASGPAAGAQELVILFAP